jgi:signal transduction histidine kinase
MIKEEIKKLKELDKIKNDFVDRASHELKTPLNFISFASSLLYDDNKDVFDRKSLNLLITIRKGTNRLKTLVNDLLNVSMMESKKFEVELKIENISEILLECLNDILIMVEERDQFLSYDIHEDIFIRVDKIKIEQAILNILINATKYTSKNGEIYVGLTKKNNEYIEITIKDTGIGFLEKEKNQIFKKFGKIKRHRKIYDIEDDGPGLGLYLAKKIIDQHGGNISLESNGRNRGSTFIILLPQKSLKIETNY